MRSISHDSWLPSTYRRLPGVALVFLLVVPCAAQTDSTSPQAADNRLGPNPVVAPASPPVPDEALDQINALRQKLGGGVAEQLQGLFPDEQQGRRILQRDFDERFRGLQSQRSAASHDAFAERSTGFTDRRPLAQARQQTLWRAARQLESVAADLEQVHAHQLADDIRAQAGQLWQLARHGSTDGPASSPDENPPRPVAP